MENIWILKAIIITKIILTNLQKCNNEHIFKWQLVKQRKKMKIKVIQIQQTKLFSTKVEKKIYLKYF